MNSVVEMISKFIAVKMEIKHFVNIDFQDMYRSLRNTNNLQYTCLFD